MRRRPSLRNCCSRTPERVRNRPGGSSNRSEEIWRKPDCNGSSTRALADARIDDFRAFAASVLGWRFSPMAYAGTPEAPIPPELEAALPEAGETLRPDYAVRELEPQDGASPWQLLVRVLGPDDDFDA